MVKKFTGENFEAEVLSGPDLVLVDFYADWCGPCKMLAPILEEVANERDDLVVGKINVDEASDIVAQYKIVSVPTMYLFKNGEILARWVGFHSQEEILALIDSYN